MGADARVLVTRPAGQADGLTAMLRAAGWETQHLPLLQIEAIDPLPDPARQRLLDLDRYDHLVFVSANAARIGLDRIAERWPQWPLGQQYWAVGESTALVLQNAGLEVVRPDRDMSSEGLLALPGLADVDGQRVLIVRGEGGRQLIAETLRGRGASVDALCCYRRAPVAHAASELLASLEASPVDLIMISSGEGLELLSRLLRPREHTNLAAITVLVPSPRVAALARELGWQHAETAENASDPAMLAAARHWREARSGETRH